MTCHYNINFDWLTCHSLQPKKYPINICYCPFWYPKYLQVISLPFCPESPKYLLLDKNDDNSATSALAWLRNVKPSEVKSEMDEMRAESETIKSLPKVTFKNMLMDPALRSPLIIAMMMMLAQQLSGEYYIITIHIFWEGHKILRNIHLTFDCMCCSQK